MRDFYTRVLGLQVTNEDKERGLAFLSSRPDAEDHEVLLTGGRSGDPDAKVLQQIAFHVESLEEVRRYYRFLKQEGVPITSTVTHGNTASIYFKDPEGNTLEIYYSLPVSWPQPFGKPIDLEQDDEGILQQIRAVTTGATSRP
jgi:catechol-2,3-dioxygenase